MWYSIKNGKETKKMNKTPVRIIWCVLGFVCLGLGTIGVALPVLPTVPFYMATVFCFARSFRKLHDWFVGTKLYRKHLDSYVRQRAMTIGTKLRIFCMVTAVMALGFLCMKNATVGRICLVIVWMWHLWYFFFRIKTIGQKETGQDVHCEQKGYGND